MTTNGPISHYEFTSRSIARYELLAFAQRLGWPEVRYRAHTVQVIAGERQWREAGLVDPAARRDAYAQLLQIEHRKERQDDHAINRD